MKQFTVNELNLNAKVELHDSSVTGIRYKLVVTLPKRLPSGKPRLYRGPITMNMPPRPKPKKNVIGPWVVDIGNALSRSFGFAYTYNPHVTFGKGVTYFTYFFNCVDTAQSMGLKFRPIEYQIAKRHQTQMVSEGHYAAFQSPYLYSNTVSNE